jgi:nicotinamide riboside transporter PnuC
MDFMQISIWIVSIIALIGTIANANAKRWCFYVWFWTNIFFVVIDFKAGLYGQSALFLCYAVMAIMGLINWKKKGIK